MPDILEIPPALSEREWADKYLIVQARRYGEPGMPSEHHGAAEIHVGADSLHITDHQNDRWAVIDTPEQRHALAALCLYGQPFGFTHDELEAMTILVREVERSYVFRHNREDGEALCESALAKIRALLPPKSLP